MDGNASLDEALAGLGSRTTTEDQPWRRFALIQASEGTAFAGGLNEERLI